jgi:hypothetical protein
MHPELQTASLNQLQINTQISTKNPCISLSAVDGKERSASRPGLSARGERAMDVKWIRDWVGHSRPG